jgi:hypothetical protein
MINGGIMSEISLILQTSGSSNAGWLIRHRKLDRDVISEPDGKTCGEHERRSDAAYSEN